VTATSVITVDQEGLQVGYVRQLAPRDSRSAMPAGEDGSRTQPQVHQSPSPADGDLPKPAQLGDAFYHKAREIRRDPTVRLVRELSMAPILTAEWEFETRPDAPRGAQELVQELMTEMRLPLLRSSLCGQCDYGWQPYEVVADQRSDGVSAPRLKPLLQDLTAVLVNAADGSFFGLRQDPSVGFGATWVYLLSRDDECFVVSQDVEGTCWYGEPTLKSLERTYDEAEIINKSARKYDSKIAGTHWVIYYPLGVSTMGGESLDNGEVARRLLQRAEAVGGMVVPRSVVNSLDTLNAAMASSEASQWKIELLTDSGKGQAPFTERLKYLDVLKVRAFGFPERAILEGQFGTKAEAESHGDIAVANQEVKHALLCGAYNRKVVDPILRWNYGPGTEGSVRIKPAPLTDKKRGFFEQLYLALIANPQSFMTEMSALDTAQMRDRLGLPELEYDPMAVDPMQGMVDPVTGMLTGPQEPSPAEPLGWGMAFDESQHPRDPGGEGGGQFVEKGASYSGEWVMIKGLQVPTSGYEIGEGGFHRTEYVHPSAGYKVVVRKETTYKKSGGRLRDPSGTRNTAHVEIQGPDVSKQREHAVSYVVRGESWEDKKKMEDKLAKYLKKNFGIDENTPRKASAQLSLRGDLDRAADGTDVDPTDKQREAGNYRKGKVRVHGVTVAIETPKGERRKPEWPRLPAHYGYIRRTEGSDGDHVDVFVGGRPGSGRVFVVDQADKSGEFDEHKVMLGFKSEKRAVRAYSDAYGGREPGAVTELTVKEFRRWLERGDTTKPLAMGRA
jgi:hypothetical protein